ncbi:MAG: phosphotransferase [Pyrinomonadaceae bacterium]
MSRKAWLLSICLKDLITKALAQYSDVKPPFTLARVLRGHVSKNWLVTSSGNEYILKVHGKETSLDRVRFITSSQQYIWLTTRRAPRICRTVRGSLFDQSNDAYFVLSEYILGTSYRPAELANEDYRRIGEFLGLVHSSYYKWFSYRGSPENLSVPRKPQERIAALINYHTNVSNDFFCREALQYKYAELERFSTEQTDRLRDLPMQIIHGDFYLDNLLFGDGREISALVDYDQSCRFFRSYELMKAIVFTLFQRPENHESENAIGYLISGYLKAGSLSYGEASNMAELYHWILLSDTFCFEPNQCPDRDFSRLREFGKRRISMIRWVAKMKERIQQIAGSLCQARGRT